MEGAKRASVRESEEYNVDESDEDARDRVRDSIDESLLSGLNMRAKGYKDSGDENNDCEDGNKYDDPDLGQDLNWVCSMVDQVVRRIVAADDDKD
jgi:hypothetical protein